jgi:histidinol dehydrogenase
VAPGSQVADAVRTIVDAVRQEGDAAVLELTERFDGVHLESLRVPTRELEAALVRIPSGLRTALEHAWSRLLAYNALEAGTTPAYETPGVRVSHLEVAVDRAGCYAPGGLARYPSSVLMCAAPAQVAGVRELVLCVPPAAGGTIDDATLAAAKIAGYHEVYAIGGAQAIAAMALGTQTIERVDVIVGPGNAYVAEAKRQLSGEVGVASSFAGPSEVIVVADSTTPPELAAIDLMVQAEHGPDGMAWLITWDPEVARSVDAALDSMVSSASRRAQLEATLSSNGVACVVDSPMAAMVVANKVAPEHLELLVADYDELVPQVRAAGAVFCGIDAPASLGDYAVGPNHILPTNRSARFASALRPDDFRRHIHVVEVSRLGLESLADTVETLAEAEGLDAHAESIRRRR